MSISFNAFINVMVSHCHLIPIPSQASDESRVGNRFADSGIRLPGEPTGDSRPQLPREVERTLGSGRLLGIQSSFWSSRNGIGVHGPCPAQVL